MHFLVRRAFAHWAPSFGRTNRPIMKMHRVIVPSYRINVLENPLKGFKKSITQRAIDKNISIIVR